MLKEKKNELTTGTSFERVWVIKIHFRPLFFVRDMPKVTVIPGGSRRGKDSEEGH
jgi:hypothetical protein